VPPGNLKFYDPKTAIFCQIWAFFGQKIMIFEKIINILYEIRSVPPGKMLRN